MSPMPSTLFFADVRVLAPKGLNTSIYLDLNRISRHSAWAHGFMHTYALWLGPVVVAAVFLAAYAVAWWRRSPHATLLLALGGLGTLVALGLNQIVGHAARELRPYATHPHALVLVGKTTDYSFPSDHSIVAGGLTMSLLLAIGAATWRGRRASRDRETDPVGRSRRFVPVMVILALVDLVFGLFLCFARVYVGAHYPGDVVAGWLLAASVVGVASLLRPMAYRLGSALETTLLAVLWRRPEMGAA